MKKILAFVLVVSLVSVVGVAVAGPRGYGRGGAYQDCPQYGQGGGYGMRGQGYGMGGGFGGRGGYGMGGGFGMQNLQLTDEFITKMAEVQKMNIDLRTELQKTNVDKAKAMELYKKISVARQEIADLRFAQYLESLK